MMDKKGRTRNFIETGKRSCNHDHGKIKNIIKDTCITNGEHTLSDSVKDDDEMETGNLLVDILKSDERPVTASSGRRSGLFNGSARPTRSHVSQRPASSRSTFEHIPGTRPASRRVCFV